MSTAVETFDLAETSLRSLNQHLHDLAGQSGGRVVVTNPSGAHAVACGIDAELEVDVEGHVGYYCAGMNKLATVRVHGNAGSGLAENMMSGRVEVDGSASQYCGATAHGGLIVVRGDTSLRCGISLKGGEIVVRGSVGGSSMFMAQAGALVVCEDAGDRPGRLALRGAHLRARLGRGTGRRLHREGDAPRAPDAGGELLERAGIDDVEPGEFRRYGSARQLYTFKIDNAGAY